MNIRYIKRHLPLRNNKKVAHILLGCMTFGLALFGTSLFVVQAAGMPALPAPISPIPKATVVHKPESEVSNKAFKKQQQFCEDQITLFEQQIEANTYIKQHIAKAEDQKRISEEINILEAKLATQIRMCHTLDD